MLKKDIVKQRTAHARRRARIRSHLTGTQERPRLSVFRSLKHVNAELIDDTKGITLTGIMSKNVEVKEVPAEYTGKTRAAFAAGLVLAKDALAKGIVKVVFDRGGYQYHGRVKAFAEGARKGGLEF